ncbi:hypothetical protein BDW67DRAFT_185792 [Aspergillus spinulosporus]
MSGDLAVLEREAINEAVIQQQELQGEKDSGESTGGAVIRNATKADRLASRVSAQDVYASIGKRQIIALQLPVRETERARQLEKAPAPTTQSHWRLTAAAQCAGYFYDEFWQRLVHQVSEEQPAVCHAVISLGSLKYQFLQLRMGNADSANNGRAVDTAFSLQQCNKAIASVRQRLLADRLGPQSKELALIMCIVLVSILLLQEDAQSAGCHLRSGLKLLEAYMEDPPRHSATSSAISQAFAGLHLGWLSFSAPEDLVQDGVRSRLFP